MFIFHVKFGVPKRSIVRRTNLESLKMGQFSSTDITHSYEGPEIPTPGRNERRKKWRYLTSTTGMCVLATVCFITLIVGLFFGLWKSSDAISCPEPTKLTVSYELHKARISWGPGNAECKYVLRYKIDGDPETHDRNVTGTGYLLTGNFGDCSILHVNVSAITTGKVTENHVSGIFAVTPIDTTIYDLHMEKPVDNTALVTWHSLSEHLLCDRLYMINTTNSIPEKNLSNTCRGISSCEITLGDFCPGVYIVAVATSIHGTIMPNAEEVTAHFTHVCGQNVDVKQRNRRP